MSQVVKSYVIPHGMNRGKELRVMEQISAQQELLLENSVWLQDYFTQHGYIPAYRSDTSGVRHKDAYVQVKGTFKAWLEGCVPIGRAVIGQLGIDDDKLRHELHSVNLRKKWLDVPEKYSDTAREYSRVIFDFILAAHPYPCVGFTPTVTMCQANSIYTRLPKSARHFDAWVSFPSGKAHAPIHIPLSYTDHYLSQPGEQANTLTFQVVDNRVQVRACKKSEPAPGIERDGTLALDWGLNALFATSDERLLGVELYTRLKKLDQQITEYQAKAQCLGTHYKQHKRYKRLMRRLRESVKNEVGRTLNQLSNEGWAELVVEDLDFRCGGLSRTMNRLISRAGRAAIRRKLDSLPLQVTRCNPALTSQECSKCGYINKTNRNGQVFRCGHCHYTTHADINAARTIATRRSEGALCVGWTVARVRANRNASFTSRHDACDRRDGQCYLSAGNNARQDLPLGVVGTCERPVKLKS